MRNLKETIYQELGFESLQQRRWYRKLHCLFKIIKNRSPSHLFQLVPSSNNRYMTKTPKIFHKFVRNKNKKKTENRKLIYLENEKNF